MKERGKRAFNLVIATMMPLTMSLLCGGQIPLKEGSMILIMMRMRWDISAGPRTMTIVESIKMIVEVPNKNMCPSEWNKGPLELQEGARRDSLSVCAGDVSIWE